MSYNRQPYDVCSYNYQLAESVGPGIYQITRPNNVCEPCHTSDPRIILQSQGVSVSRNSSLIDIDSDLIGINRNLSDCPSRKYFPDANASFQGGAQTGTVRGSGCRPTDKVCIDNSNSISFKDCFTPVEDTRLSNPPSTLRGTGWNRWEWLCRNPQDRVTEPFDFQINTKLVSKDNHRPCLPNPIDQFIVYPVPSDKPICQTIMKVASPPTMPPSVSWQTAQVISQY